MGGCAFYVETANQKWKRVGVVSGDSDTNDVYSPSLSKYQNLLKNVLIFGERRAEDEDHKGRQHRLLDGVVAIQAFIILWFF